MMMLLILLRTTPMYQTTRSKYWLMPDEKKRPTEVFLSENEPLIKKNIVPNNTISIHVNITLSLYNIVNIQNSQSKNHKKIMMKWLILDRKYNLL